MVLGRVVENVAGSLRGELLTLIIVQQLGLENKRMERRISLLQWRAWSVEMLNELVWIDLGRR